MDGEVSVLVLCHTRAAFQIKNEYALLEIPPAVKVAVFYGGVPISANKKAPKEATLHIVVGTLSRSRPHRLKDLNLSKLKHFVRPSAIVCWRLWTCAATSRRSSGRRRTRSRS